MQPVLAHVGSLSLAPLQLGPLAIAAVLYALRVRALASTRNPVAGWRQACFHGGLLLVALALASPLGHVAEELFVAHMAEHLIIADVASLLLVLGLTGPVLQPVLKQPGLRWVRHLAHPVPALLLWATNLYAWHVPALHEAALHSGVVHAAQHAGFLLCGANVWMALLGPLPKPPWFGNLAACLTIVGVRLTGAVLANVFVFGHDAFYGAYAAGEASWGISPAADQNAAGGLMMVEESILTVLLFGWLFLKAGREDDERRELLDLAAARGVPLEERRAARAVAAGRGAELRARITATPRG